MNNIAPTPLAYRRPRPRVEGSRRFLPHALLLFAVVALAGCGSGHSTERTDDAALPQDCNDFVASYQRYLASASPSAGAIAEARAKQTRTALVEEARHGSPTALASRCRDSLRTLPAPPSASSSSP